MSSYSQRFQHTLVIARYKEDISWVKRVPEQFKIVIYNKGKSLSLLRKWKLKREGRVSIRKTRNIGREAETYLRYLKETPSYGDHHGFTVFCQGDPFEHSPDFLKLLHHTSRWKPLQPLSYRWRENKEIPPLNILEMDKSNFIEGLRIRVEIYSLYSLGTVHYSDNGIFRITNSYISKHNLSEGVNLSYHFLSRCGLPEVALAAASHKLGQFTFGAIFAVANPLLDKLPDFSIHMMHELSKENAIHSYLFERNWLHIFGKSFLFPD